MALRKVASFWKSDKDKSKARLRGNAEREGVTLPPNAKLLLFDNDKGDNPKRPDFRLMVVEDDELPETPSGGSYNPPPDDESGLPF